MKRWVLAACLVVAGCHATARTPTPAELIASKRDILGDAALKQQGGATYASFEHVLPPLRYVDADFRHYPIVLSAPNALAKGKLISNGSGINLRARQPTWNNESGTPVHINVGPSRVPFGNDLTKLDGPHLLDRHLPIVQLAYTEAGETYRLEAFASVDPVLAKRGAVLVRFDVPQSARAKLELRFETGYEVCKFDDHHVVRDPAGNILAQFDDNWEFNVARSAALNKIEHAFSIHAIIFSTSPAPSAQRAADHGVELEGDALPATSRPATQPATAPIPALTADVYQHQREASIRCWTDILASGTQLSVPEPIVMDAWRTLLIAQHAIRAGDQLNYSALNQYARQYANESGDTMRSLALWGHTDAARAGFKPLLKYRRPGIELHDAGFALEDLADYYFLTRDAEAVRELRPLWQPLIDMILATRQSDGLLPKEAYCSDIRTPVRSINNNANCWRGLRDMAIVLEEIGDREQAARLAKLCAEYRKVTLAAMKNAIDRSVNPPFVRIALDGEEPISNPITSTRYGSYWNLVIPCVLWSGLFPIDSEPANAIIDHIQQNGGLCMGLTRVQSNRGAWANVQNIDDLYVIRYALALLKRDEPDRALVTFYGKLAQGFTRETFIDGEVSGIQPIEHNGTIGRQMGLPPNSTSSASFLMQLRYLLVQDWDMDEDGKADTLNLAFATPRAWLQDGKTIAIKKAPTAFGPVSFELHRKGKTVRAEIDLPSHVPPKCRLRLRAPEGDREIDLAGKSGHFMLDVTLNK